jgi:hypothetical protein
VPLSDLGLFVLRFKDDALWSLGEAQPAAWDEVKAAPHRKGNYQTSSAVNGNHQWHNGNDRWVDAPAQVPLLFPQTPPCGACLALLLPCADL